MVQKKNKIVTNTETTQNTIWSKYTVQSNTPSQAVVINLVGCVGCVGCNVSSLEVNTQGKVLGKEGRRHGMQILS